MSGWAKGEEVLEGDCRKGGIREVEAEVGVDWLPSRMCGVASFVAHAEVNRRLGAMSHAAGLLANWDE